MGLASRKPPKPNLDQHKLNMDQLIPGLSEKPNPHLILPFFGLQVASFPSLTGPNLQAALASNPQMPGGISFQEASETQLRPT